MVIIVSGSGVHIAGEESFPVRAGDVLIIHPGVMHGYDQIAGLRLINVMYDRQKLAVPMLDCWQLPFFDMVYPGKNLPDAGAVLKPVVTLDEKALLAVVQLCEELDQELKTLRPGNQFGAFTRFMELLLLLARHCAEKKLMSGKRNDIDNVVAYINEHFTENIPVEKMLKIANMSRRNFFRWFKISTGYTPMEFVIRKRLQLAVRYLNNTDNSIGELAILCGFYDSNFFCKQFRKEFHCSPRKFRQNNGVLR
jgi:AraC family L-rhamnose operon transcriptional activator RhaR/AraC family L-rhamnose operon regulatory protein RhaS